MSQEGNRERRASADDLALIKRLLAGEPMAFQFLVERYHGRLLRFAMTFVSERSAAEEVVQETWLGVMKGLDTFEGRSSLHTWIFRILANRAKTRAVRDARSLPFSAFGGFEDEDEPAVDPARFHADGTWAVAPRQWDDDTPEKLLLQQEAVYRLEQAVAQLPVAQRAVVSLRDIEGLDANEVCNILGISETNQRVLLHRARSRLRRTLEEYLR